MWTRLLIARQRKRGDIFSWTYAPGTGELAAVTDNGTARLYVRPMGRRKPPRRMAEGGRGRRIVRGESLELTPLDAKARIVETIEYGSGVNAPEEFE